MEPTEQLFQGFLETIPDAIIGVDSTGRITFVNAEVEQLFGYQRDELIGEPVEILVPEGFRDLHREDRTVYLQNPKPRPMGALQLAGQRKDGSQFRAEISLSAFQTDRGLIVSAAVRDVTERVRADAERERYRADADRDRIAARMIQAQRLESLGLLAGGVAHDFNNLIGAIRNYAAFIAKTASVPGDATGRERWASVLHDARQIEQASERATGLTRQLLIFGRRDRVQPQALILSDVIVGLEDLLRRTLGEHIELATAFPPDLAPVFADPGQIEQILVNLAVNARDAMPKGGQLRVDLCNIDVDQYYSAAHPPLAAGPYVRLQISDTGSGMDRATIDRAFEPFFTTKPKGEGTGLGLATVYGIVTQAGGSVHIYSEPDRGTTFSILLPVSDETPDRETVAVIPSQFSTDRGTILVVEDDAAMREVTIRILVDNGYMVLSAAGGAEAIAIVEAERDRIDLLLTDVVMPKMLGREVAERIVAIEPSIKVVYMSGYAFSVLDAQGTLGAGAILVEKPFTEEMLIHRLGEAFAMALPG